MLTILGSDIRPELKQALRMIEDIGENLLKEIAVLNDKIANRNEQLVEVKSDLEMAKRAHSNQLEVNTKLTRIIEEAMCALASHGLVPPADDLPEWNHDDPQFGELRLAWRKFFIGQE
jgi:hypothetical protein